MGIIDEKISAESNMSLLNSKIPLVAASGALMNITEPRFEKYMKDISLHSQLRSEDDIILREMEAYASENHFPIIGPLVGRFLRQLAIITKAESIFEMGSGYGYSAAWFAGGMKPGGKIICTEGSGG